MNTQGEDRHLQAKGRGPQKKQILIIPWSWTSGFQKSEEINFCCLKHSLWVLLHSPSKLVPFDNSLQCFLNFDQLRNTCWFPIVTLFIYIILFSKDELHFSYFVLIWKGTNYFEKQNEQNKTHVCSLFLNFGEMPVYRSFELLCLSAYPDYNTSSCFVTILLLFLPTC